MTRRRRTIGSYETAGVSEYCLRCNNLHVSVVNWSHRISFFHFFQVNTGQKEDFSELNSERISWVLRRNVLGPLLVRSLYRISHAVRMDPIVKARRI